MLVLLVVVLVGSSSAGVASSNAGVASSSTGR